MAITKLKKSLISQTAVIVLALLLSLGAFAAPTLDLTKGGTIVINLRTPDAHRQPVEAYGFELFKLADAYEEAGELKFKIKDEIAESGINLADLDLTDASQTKAAAQSFADFLAQKSLKGRKGQTNEEGNLTFGGLTPGLYLIRPDVDEGDFAYYPLQPILVALPFLNAQGNAWKFAVNVYPKLEEDKETTTQPDESTQPSQPDDGTTRPQDDDTQAPPTRPWDEDQTTLPADQSGQGSGGKPTLPQTGLLRWPVPILSSAGILIFALGWADINLRKRKEDDE